MCFGRIFKTKKAESAGPSPSNSTTALLYDVHTLQQENEVLKRDNEMKKNEVRNLKAELELRKQADPSLDMRIRERFWFTRGASMGVLEDAEEAEGAPAEGSGDDSRNNELKR